KRNDFIFHSNYGGRRNAPIDTQSTLLLTKKLAHPDIWERLHRERVGKIKYTRLSQFGPTTVHGFRSAFADWGSEEMHYPENHVDTCLGHTVRGQVRSAYFRGDLLEKRAEIMAAWALYCRGVTTSENIIQMRRA